MRTVKNISDLISLMSEGKTIYTSFDGKPLEVGTHHLQYESLKSLFDLINDGRLTTPEDSEEQPKETPDELAALTRKIKIYEEALQDIAKSTKWQEGDYTYNVRYESPTGDAYTAMRALKDAGVELKKKEERR